MDRQEMRLQLESLGWRQRDLPGFIGKAGPLWTRKEEDGWTYGVLCAEEHLNPAGVAHGGMVATLLDHAISTVGWEVSGRAPCVTLQLDTHFLAAVRPGEFAQARARLNHRSGALLFMNGTVCVGQTGVACGQAILKVLRNVG